MNSINIINLAIRNKYRQIYICHRYLKEGGSQYRSRESCIDHVVQFRKEWRYLFITRISLKVHENKT